MGLAEVAQQPVDLARRRTDVAALHLDLQRPAEQAPDRVDDVADAAVDPGADDEQLAVHPVGRAGEEQRGDRCPRRG